MAKVVNTTETLAPTQAAALPNALGEGVDVSGKVNGAAGEPHENDESETVADGSEETDEAPAPKKAGRPKKA